MLLRKGLAASGGGVDVNSLASAANSSGGLDAEYSATGWSRSDMPFLMGTPDTNGDLIPDMWAIRSDGSVASYPGSRTSVVPTSGTQVIAPSVLWLARIAIG
ncbi:hypothetical protein ACFWP7_11560 [Streptomyces sp. NPDC058470]|uniref:hypothetical protein n=1 Tax=Streptomyces sp. NPDC058470 TaxID=3346515 RepID=UPI00364CEF8D